MWLFCRLLLLACGILAVNFHLAIHQGDFAAPMSVTLEGLDAADIATAKLWMVDLRSHRQIVATRPGHWECPPRCVVAVYLRMPEPMPAPTNVRVAIGARTFTLPMAQLEHTSGAYWLPDEINAGPAPSWALCRNWPGMPAFVAHWLSRSAPGLVTILLLALISAIGMRESFRERFQAMLGLTPTVVDAPSPDRTWNIIGWIGLVAGFVGLQYLEPYYFTQDDALVGELPGILLGCRSLWQGTFPDWNPYVFMGAPLATIGFWAITYPPQLLSYAIARHVLGDEFATMEVFAAMHLLAGFIAMRHLSRRIGMGPMAANLAALSFVFAGCILIMGRSWHAFIANAAWLPLLGIAIQRFREGPVGWKWIVGVGVVLGLSYHAGFPQIVAILGMFLVVGLASIAIADRLPVGRLLPAIPAVLLGVGISAPLLLHHLQMTGGHERFVPAEHGVHDYLHAAVLPYPLAQAGLPTEWGSIHIEKMGHFYFFGGVFAILFALQVVCFWMLFPQRSAWARAWWLPSGIVALLLVLGEPAGLWQGLSLLPMAKFFLRYSFRFYPWLAFCAILSGGLILERMLALMPRRRQWEMIVGAALLVVLAWHLAMCRPSFHSYGFRPYPDLPADFESAFHPYDDKSFVGEKNSRRMASWHRQRSSAADYAASMPFNLPHYYQVPSIFGYDPVVEGQPRIAEVQRRLHADPIAACKAYGVGWHVFSFSEVVERAPDGRVRVLENTVQFDSVYRKLVQANLAVTARHNDTTLKELPGVDPLAFETGRPERALPMRLHCRGADVVVTDLEPGSRVTINFLWYPHLTLELDGQPLSVEKDDWQRITTTLPSAGSTLALRYAPPWPKTCAVGAGLCLAALLLAWGTGRLRHSVRTSPSER